MGRRSLEQMLLRGKHSQSEHGHSEGFRVGYEQMSEIDLIGGLETSA